jgi:hypothetical protein
MQSAGSALHLEMSPAGKHILSERKLMLGALSALGGAEAVGALDHVAQKFWPWDDLGGARA